MSNPAFTLDADRTFRAMKIASADPTRHFLKGVRIEPINGGGVWMIATNGAIMLIQRDSEGHADHAATLAVTAPNVEIILHDDGTFEGDYHWRGAKIAVAALKPSETVAALASWHFGSPGPHVLVERLEDKFPDWRKAIGEPAKTDVMGRVYYASKPATSGFMTRSLGPLIDNRQSFRLHGNLDDMNQMFLTYADDPDSLGVLMKCEIRGEKCQPDAMLTAIGRDDLVAAKTVH